MTDAAQGPSADQSPITSEFESDPEMAELVELFVEEMPERIEKIRTAFEAEQIETLRTLAHQMKGAAPGYGFGQLGLAAGRVEDLIRGVDEDAERAEALAGRVRELIDMCSRVSRATG